MRAGGGWGEGGQREKPGVTNGRCNEPGHVSWLVAVTSKNRKRKRESEG